MTNDNSTLDVSNFNAVVCLCRHHRSNKARVLERNRGFYEEDYGSDSADTDEEDDDDE